MSEAVLYEIGALAVSQRRMRKTPSQDVCFSPPDVPERTENFVDKLQSQNAERKAAKDGDRVERQ